MLLNGEEFVRLACIFVGRFCSGMLRCGGGLCCSQEESSSLISVIKMSGSYGFYSILDFYYLRFL